MKVRVKDGIFFFLQILGNTSYLSASAVFPVNCKSGARAALKSLVEPTIWGIDKLSFLLCSGVFPLLIFAPYMFLSTNTWSHLQKSKKIVWEANLEWTMFPLSPTLCELVVNRTETAKISLQMSWKISSDTSACESGSEAH